MIQLSLTELANILNCPAPASDIIIKGISTDTRSLQPGSLFVAIRGEQFDAHDFIAEAVKKGASAVLVNRPLDLPVPQLIVSDTLDAFGKISAEWRNRFQLPVVGVTGSNGKTTLKNMIASIMRAASQNNPAAVLATEGNLNNNIGVPIMLSRLNQEHHFAVIEMGMNHFHEIDYLTKLTRPHVAVITNAAEAHLEGLKDVAGVARAKGEIFLGLQVGGTAVLNRDDAHYDYWLTLVKPYKVLSFGLDHPADITAEIHANSSLTIKTPQGNIDVTLPLLGKHNILNALAATAAALASSISLEAIKKGLEHVQAAPGRMRQYHLDNGAKIIDDTYNANPFSTLAAIKTLASLPGTQILVLADMKELGGNAKELHFATGEKAREAGIHTLFTFGDLSAAISEGFGKGAAHFTDKEKLAAALRPLLKNHVTVLVKGSRSMGMEKVVEMLVPHEQLEHSH